LVINLLNLRNILRKSLSLISLRSLILMSKKIDHIKRNKTMLINHQESKEEEDEWKMTEEAEEEALEVSEEVTEAEASEEDSEDLELLEVDPEMIPLPMKVGMEEEEMMMLPNLEVEEEALEVVLEEASEEANLVEVEVAHMVQAEEVMTEETIEPTIMINHMKKDVAEDRYASTMMTDQEEAKDTTIETNNPDTIQKKEAIK
jgi:hypothetical protein